MDDDHGNKGFTLPWNELISKSYVERPKEGKEKNFMLGRLVPIGGGDDIILKKEELTLGRREENDIVLRFNNVSGRHCRLVLSNGYWYVIDLGSTNGVKVNSLRTADHRIDPGAKVSFAGHIYVMEYDPMENGAQGVIPPDVLESNILDKSLMERAGLSRSSRLPQETPEKKEESKPLDYESLDLDDIEFL